MRGSTTNWTRSCAGTSRSRGRLKRKHRRRGPRAVDMAGITVAAMSCCETGPCSSRTWDMLRRAGGMGSSTRAAGFERVAGGSGNPRRARRSDAGVRAGRPSRRTPCAAPGGAYGRRSQAGRGGSRRRCPSADAARRTESRARGSPRLRRRPSTRNLRGRGVGRARATISGRDPRAVARAPRRRAARVGTPSGRRGRPPRARRRSCS